MYLSVKHNTTAKYWDSKKDFLVGELKAYVNDLGNIVIPAPYYSENKEDRISSMSYNMDEFTKDEALEDFAINYVDKILRSYFYELHYINK